MRGDSNAKPSCLLPTISRKSIINNNGVVESFGVPGKWWALWRRAIGVEISQYFTIEKERL